MKNITEFNIRPTLFTVCILPANPPNVTSLLTKGNPYLTPPVKQSKQFGPLFNVYCPRSIVEDISTAIKVKNMLTITKIIVFAINPL